MDQLEGRAAIITGAAGRIGGASALAFARAGARVVASDIQDEKGQAVVDRIRDEGGDAIYVHCDATDVSEVDALVAQAATTYGGVDALHTNPFWCSSSELANVTDENWSTTLAVTLDSVMICSRAVIREMLKRGGGALVHTSSVNGVVISMDNSAPYCAAKGGVIQLSRAIAKDYGRKGIRSNTICPGNVIAREHGPEQLAPDNIISWQTCLGRSAYADEIANVAVFLASDAASYITGATVMADCGWTTT